MARLLKQPELSPPDSPDLPSGSLLLTLVKLPHFLGLSLAVFLLGFGLSIANPYLSLFGINEVKMSPFSLGVFLTLSAVGSIVISTFLARWSDRLPNRKPILLLTLAAGATAYLLLSMLRSYPLLLLNGMVFIGLSAAAFPQLFSFAKAQFSDAPNDLPERALTVLRTMFSLAYVVGPGLGAVLLAQWGFRWIFLCATVCFILATLPILRVPGRKPQATRTAQVPLGHQPANRSTVTWVAVAFVCYGMSMSMGFTMFPLFITNTLHGNAGQVGFLVGLCALLEIPAMLALATLKRLPSTERLIKVAFLLFALHFALVYLASDMPLLIVTQVIRAAVLAVTAGLGMQFFQELMPGRLAAATTLYSTCTSTGAMIAGIVSGVCAEFFGYRAVFLLCAALIFCGWVVMQTMVKKNLNG